MATSTLEAAVTLLKFIWISYCADAAKNQENCRVTVTQPQYIEADATLSNTTIPCTFSADGCHSSPTTVWFRYFSHNHEDLCTPICANTAKFRMDSSSLQIKNVGAEDVAVYFCGVAFPNSHTPTSKQTGGGTTLVLRGTKKYSQGINIMVATSSLLLLYLIAMLVILKFFSKPKVKNTEKEGLKTKHSVCSKENRQAIGQAIAKELCKKKPGRCKRTGRLDKAQQKR
ncbi:immunoglobulin superfamily member 6 [Tiliqua scincoides]|uniref:immunoglobulin superfamily member 6 n=1 Tax=Tiliqua scincoides TaxID=71010 RepID=UPI003462FFF9